jgi:hypothetical protein
MMLTKESPKPDITMPNCSTLLAENAMPGRKRSEGEWAERSDTPISIAMTGAPTSGTRIASIVANIAKSTLTSSPGRTVRSETTSRSPAM